MNIEELENEVCQDIPSKFNLYKWAKENPDTTIAHAIKRTQKIFDDADEIFFGFSGGKDSTLTTELAILELKIRRKRAKVGIDRDGNDRVDPLDEKWLGKRLYGNSMDSEWVWSHAIEHTKEFLQEHGPGKFNIDGSSYFGNDIIKTRLGPVEVRKVYEEIYEDKIKSLDDYGLKYINVEIKGDDTISMFYKCLMIGWQSGVTFGESRITSWDTDKKDIWIRPMPIKDELSGFDPITNFNIYENNLVPLESLSKEMQELRIQEESVIDKNDIKMVPNFGLGNHDLELQGYPVDFQNWTFINQDEDNEQDLFARWLLECFPNGTQIYNLVALRAAESFDRYTILKQSDYNTGEYASSKID